MPWGLGALLMVAAGVPLLAAGDVAHTRARLIAGAFLVAEGTLTLIRRAVHELARQGVRRAAPDDPFALR